MISVKSRRITSFFIISLMVFVLSGCNFLSRDSDGGELLMLLAIEDPAGEDPAGEDPVVEDPVVEDPVVEEQFYVLTKEEVRYVEDDRLFSESNYSYDDDLNEINYEHYSGVDNRYTITKKEYSDGKIIKETTVIYSNEKTAENILTTVTKSTSYDEDGYISKIELTTDDTADESLDLNLILDYHCDDDGKVIGIDIDSDSEIAGYETVVEYFYNDNGSIEREKISFSEPEAEYVNRYAYYQNGNLKEKTIHYDIEDYISDGSIDFMLPGVFNYSYIIRKLDKTEIDLYCNGSIDWIVYSYYDDNGNLSKEELDLNAYDDEVDLIFTYTWELR